ncbi:uncharacterized protein LOC129222678 [Uloborus diversus]|uniref:uncharacterized protein LOC129222678 n=1 Tax=Uloborus diversus TaxID=327109 RepID=UPI002408F90F|nr:uncharacterized protein LOC129222678 [Uloborus diversus]XP_054713194.1 uncharacterized protein LOC129222678 [Uloborus diversus]
MDKKLTHTPRRSPYFCCHGLFYGSVVRTALLSTILILCSLFVTLVLIGALYAHATSLFFYVIAAVLLSAATMMILFYIWLDRTSSLLRIDYSSKMPVSKTEISTLSDYYNQVPLGLKSDYPMGPYLIMTLPKSTNGRMRSGTLESDYSMPNTPLHIKKKAARRAKNLPPLASAETLTPSLMSSCYGSIDSVV